MAADTIRKPSGSSSHSRAHSPAGSPGNAQSNRKVHQGIYGAGVGQVGQAGNFKPTRNAGWEMWGSVQPSSRNPSASSAASANELSPSQSDANFRGNTTESWTTGSRPASGAWPDDSSDTPQNKEFGQLESLSPLSLQPPRLRQGTVTQATAFPGTRIDERVAGPQRNGQFPPQQMERGRIAEATGSHVSSSVSPIRPYSTAIYPAAQPPVQQSVSGDNYESAPPPATTEELALSLRGMVVQDDRNIQPQAFPMPALPPPPPSMPQPQHVYNAYPRTDFNSYFPAPPPEPYIEFSFGYGAPTDPSLYSSPIMNHISPSHIYPGISPQSHHISHGMPGVPPPIIHHNGQVEMRQQAGFLYDPRSSQFYYPPPPPIIFQPSMHSPIISTAVGPGIPPNVIDNKHEIQYNTQHHIPPPNHMYGPPVQRSSPTPSSQSYPPTVEYRPTNVVLPGGHGYVPSKSNSHQHHYGVRSGRRDVHALPVKSRSTVLEEFRSSKSVGRKWQLKEIMGYVVEFSRDQHGSRFIQQQLETANSEERQAIFDEIVPGHTLSLMQDVFGNYVIQKMIEFGTSSQKNILVNAMEGNVLRLALQMYGCRVVQKAFETILPEQQSAFVREIEPQILKCVKDSNGNHVIQKIIECVNPERLSFIQAFRGSIYDLATHPYGCRVLQRCLEHMPEEQTRPLMEEVLTNAHRLMTDKFGNYVMQFILEHGRLKDRVLVISKLRGQLLFMAKHKFASNVCEKALVFADANNRRILIDEIMITRPDGFMPFVVMMKDQYANYVLQRALRVAEGEQKDILFAKVRPQLAHMRKHSTPYNKHLVSIERLLEKYSDVPQDTAQSTP